jgi:hypothetical protein
VPRPKSTTQVEKTRPAERVRETYISRWLLGFGSLGLVLSGQLGLHLRLGVVGSRPCLVGDIVEVLLQYGAWAIGTVSLYGYPGGTSVRISVNGGPAADLLR